MHCKFLPVAGLLGFLLIVPHGLSAQDSVRKLTLTEAIDLSIKNSKHLRNDEAKIEEATAALTEAVQRKLPDASVGGSYLYLTPPNISSKVKQNNSGGGGGSGGLNLSNIKISQLMYGSLNVSLPVYGGLRIQSGIESAKAMEHATRLDADHEREEVIQNTIDAYSNLYKAKAGVFLVRESLTESQQRVTEFTNLEKNGLLARNDLLKAELETSNIELSLLDVENNFNLARVSMNLLLGLPEKTELMPDSSSFQNPVEIKSLEEYEQLAVQNRKDAQALAFRKKAAEAGTRSAKAEYYPNLALTGGYIALYLPNFISVTNAFTIGAGVKYNIGSLWKTDAKVQQAKAREKQVLANEDLLSDQIRLSINQAYQNCLVSQKKIDVYSKAIDQSAENYKISKNKYENNLLTTTDLLEAEVALLQSKLNYAAAKVDAVVAYNKLLQTAGLLDTPAEHH